ncbi:oxoglutarate/iron-dependent dioxygenase [Artemisia annua]|uniref:Oxoglutarate/iron-dependent dioxygenase n=1 Tax=Artemisia annua TaxID=35608 RepID=A0A2U1LWG3_ARTAN|nr:oxoglutarate/iron-dependent dioxygenase [Artemisia annua]
MTDLVELVLVLIKVMMDLVKLVLVLVKVMTRGLAEILEPLPELVDDHYPRLFLFIDCEGYRKLRYSKNLHDGEALALLQPPTTFKLE